MPRKKTRYITLTTFDGYVLPTSGSKCIKHVNVSFGCSQLPLGAKKEDESEASRPFQTVASHSISGCQSGGSRCATEVDEVHVHVHV